MRTIIIMIAPFCLLFLNVHLFQLSKLMSEKSDAEEHLEDVLVVVQLLANEISLSDSLRPQIDTIVNKIPLEMMEKVRRNAN